VKEYKNPSTFLTEVRTSMEQEPTMDWHDRIGIRPIILAVTMAISLGLTACEVGMEGSRQSDASTALGAETPTEESVVPEGSEPVVPLVDPDDRTMAIAYSLQIDGAAVLILADVNGNVLHEVRDLPQHQFGPERFLIKVAVSPEGTRVVYEESGSDGGNLYVRDIPDGEDRPLVVSSESLETNPVWSPDGKWIAFESDRTGQPEIFLVRPDGSDLRQLTHTDEGAGLPIWSPDGQKLAFLSPPSWEQLGGHDDIDPALSPFAIHVVNADGSDQQPVPGGDVSDPPNFVSSNDPNSA
jgi:WD40 repeat protein